MDTQNTNSEGSMTRNDRFGGERHHGGNSGRVLGGLIIITIGLIFLARQLGVDFPYWFVSWPMILIAVGLYLGVRHSFRGPAWLIVTIVGAVFLIDKIDRSLDFHRFLFPVLLIAIGLIVMLRPKKKMSADKPAWDSTPGVEESTSSEDYVDSLVIFGGVKKQIISKSFRGGKMTTIFGGNDLNLTQADVAGKIELDITQIFAGAKLIVPPHWRVESSDVVCIFGGVEDKRPPQQGVSTDYSKVLVLKGTCLFGGIDIKSF